MAATEPQIDKSIELVMEYKKGTRPLHETIDRLRRTTGLSKETAEAFLLGMTRTNVLQFKGYYDRKKKSDG